MTAFNMNNFFISAGYVTYGPCYLEAKFVARFKYKAGSAKGFASFIAKNFTVEEYFGRREAGESPLAIAESKGYVLPHIRKWLKERGLPQTPAGMKIMLEQDRIAREARAA